MPTSPMNSAVIAPMTITTVSAPDTITYPPVGTLSFTTRDATAWCDATSSSAGRTTGWTKPRP